LHIEYEDIQNPLQFSIDTILKEAIEESRLVKQITYTMLSAYTNNPINLAINSPSGEGKTWVIQKVGEKFPEEDVMYIAGMTEKALFHRSGILVTKKEKGSGEYEPIDEKISQIDIEIEDKELEISKTRDAAIIKVRKNEIKEMEEEKKSLHKDAKKLIDLSHKILVFLDSPSPGLFNALMPLLSHDRYEVEYEFVDTHNGIKTKGNILIGWPAVIFAQAIEYSHYQRYAEIQRRFIITNPKMSIEKYSGAVDLIGDKYGLPDFAYQAKVVSDSEKQKVQELIREIKEKISDACNGVEPGKNNVMIPFYEILTNSLPKEKAFDMTVANRFFSYLSLLPLIQIGKRPRLFVRKPENVTFQTMPFALFEDLKETIFLMQYANGVRPYVLEWFYDVFQTAFNGKTDKDWKTVYKGKEQVMIFENRIALTTEDLVKKTYEVYNMTYTKKQILESYINPLINQGCIDKVESELDHRASIYYPLIKTIKNRKLFDSKQSTNLSQESIIVVIGSPMFPDKQYVTSKIQAVLGYSARQGYFTKILDHEENEITIEELIDKYYNNSDEYFALDDHGPNEDPDTGGASPAHGEGLAKNIEYKGGLADYVQNDKIASESQEKCEENIEPIATVSEISKIIVDEPVSTNFLYSCYHKDCNFQTDSEQDYERHWGQKHNGIPKLFPAKTELEKYGLQAQGKDWEI
jgi:hypothetical protein